MMLQDTQDIYAITSLTGLQSGCLGLKATTTYFKLLPGPDGPLHLTNLSVCFHLARATSRHAQHCFPRSLATKVSCAAVLL